MTPTIVCLVGLPGSGKSYLADNYRRRGFVIVEDPRKLIEITHAAKAVTATKAPGMVISDPHLCREPNRRLAEALFTEFGWPLVWIYFANDPDACRANVARRATTGDTRRVTTSIDLFSRNYRPPADARPVYRRDP